MKASPRTKLEDITLYCIGRKSHTVLKDFASLNAERCRDYTILENISLALNITSNATIKQSLDALQVFSISSGEIWLLKVTLPVKNHAEEARSAKGFQYKNNVRSEKSHNFVY